MAELAAPTGFLTPRSRSLPCLAALPNRTGLPMQVVCKKKRSVPQHFTEKLYSHFFGAEPYKAYNLGAYKLLVLNSQLGHTWQSGHHACNTRWVGGCLRRLGARLPFRVPRNE